MSIFDLHVGFLQFKGSPEAFMLDEVTGLAFEASPDWQNDFGLYHLDRLPDVSGTIAAAEYEAAAKDKAMLVPRRKAIIFYCELLC